MSKKFEIKWAKSARDDLEEIIDYIAEEGRLTTAISIHDMLMGQINALSLYPERGRIVPELKEIGLKIYREVIASPYRIFFRIEAHIVIILGILDSRRDLEQVLIDRTIR